MLHGAPKRELVARMSESCLGGAGAGFFVDVDEAEGIEVEGARPNGLVAHDCDVGDGEPVAGGDMVAIGGGIRLHHSARNADCVGGGGGLGLGPKKRVPRSTIVLYGRERAEKGAGACLRIGPGLMRAVSLMKLSR